MGRPVESFNGVQSIRNVNVIIAIKEALLTGTIHTHQAHTGRDSVWMDTARAGAKDSARSTGTSQVTDCCLKVRLPRLTPEYGKVPRTTAKT